MMRFCNCIAFLKNSSKKIAQVFFALVLFSFAVFYLLHNFNFHLFVSAISQVAFFPILISIFIVVLGALVVSMRLFLLSYQRLRFVVLFNTEMVGMGLNVILPFKVGDALKIIYLRNKSDISYSEGLTFSFWERLFDLNILILMGLLASFIVKIQFLSLTLVVVIGLVWLFFITNKIIPGFYLKLIQLLPFVSVRELCGDVLAHLREKKYSFKTLLLLIMLSCLSLGSAYLLFYVIINSMVSVHLSYLQIFVVYIVSMLGFILPTTPGAIGVYEAAIVLSLGWYGVPKSYALAIAVLLHVIQSVLIAIYALLVLYANRSFFGLATKKISSGLYVDNRT